MNTEADLAVRHRRIGDIDVFERTGPSTPLTEPMARASLPRLGDVTPTSVEDVQRVVHQAYAVRDLVHRGVAIDLVG